MSENNEPGRMEPDWSEVPPPNIEYGRVGHALRKINEIDGVATKVEGEVREGNGDQTEATIELVVTDAVVDDE